MSFRLRVLLLTTLIVITAVAATAWLTLRQASREFDATISASQDDVAVIGKSLAELGRLGTWEGVAERVAELSARTGQRIRVETAAGQVLADSDLLSGGSARPTAGPPVLVDPRPVLELPDEKSAERLGRALTGSIVAYQRALRMAACLNAAGEGVRSGEPVNGVPVVVPTDPEKQAAKRCGSTVAKLRPSLTSVQLAALVRPCVAVTDLGVADCAQRVFLTQTGGFAPQPVLAYIGARDEAPPQLAGSSILLMAVVVAALAAVAALVLGRRVLRPIALLTAGARRVGAGDLSGRVVVRGDDELAELGRTFNQMADSLQDSEERQRRMVADVAHELRTPLVNLRGYLEAMRDGVLPATPELLASLHEEVLLQQRVVDDLQDLAMAEAGAMTLHPERVDLTELAQSCRLSHGARAEAAGLGLHVEARGPVPAWGDPDRLRQVLGNLIRNAIAATPPNGTITLAVRDTAGGAGISVTDTGVGIAAEDLPYVFDRFWRADAARGRASGGSGLGLAIARQIIKNHGGTITATSRPRSGTTITITLPRDPGQDP